MSRNRGLHPHSRGTDSPHLRCSVDGCTRWFRNVSGLKQHTRSQHPLHVFRASDSEPSTTGSDLCPSPEFHDPGPHSSPRYHNPTSSPPSRTPSPMDTCSSSPRSRYSFQMFPDSSDDCAYCSDDEEDEATDSDEDLGGEGIPYNESNPALTRNYHDLLNGAQSNYQFTFFSKTYKQVHHATEMDIQSPTVHLRHLQTMIQVPTTGSHTKSVCSSKLRIFYSPGSKCPLLALIFNSSCGLLHWQSMVMFLPLHHTKTCMRKSTRHIWATPHGNPLTSSMRAPGRIMMFLIG
jgi:hypothetical protein